jgi:prevent-host-death family protein
VPDTLRRFIEIPRQLTDGAMTFAFLEDVITANLHDELFPGVEIISAHLFRIIRDTDVLIRKEDSDDLLESVGRELRRVRAAKVKRMKSVDASQAQARLDEILEEAQRHPIVIRRQGQDTAVVVSIAEYERVRLANVQSFLQLRKEVADEAATSGLTEERLAKVLNDRMA